jgi:phosphate transport system substrate-binding protein
MNTLTATVAAFGLGATAAFASQQISIKGSDTLLILNQRWAEAYAKVRPSVSIAVTGGGSAIGINAFINGVTDIAASSREIKRSEIDKAMSRGFRTWEIRMALDGLAIAVNSNNPVKSLTMDQLRRIYVGQITNWSQVGGDNEPIVCFSRDSNSGTYAFVQQKVLKMQNWGKGVRFLPSTSEEEREVARTSGGIAYGGVAYFKNKRGIRIVPIAANASSNAIAPTEDNVRSHRYPIWRYLYYYTNGAPKGELLKYINWALSADGQKIAEEVGYYSLK